MQMNQPKFNFTDILTHKSWTAGRKPYAIYMRDNGYYYSFSETEIGYSEESLELYQEPQKKKLYAYEWETGWGKEIRLFKREDIPGQAGLIRSQDDDIEYPEAK